MPNIGYGSARKTKHMLPNGFRKVLVHNLKVSVHVMFIFFCFIHSKFYFYCLGIGSTNDDESKILCRNCPFCVIEKT